MHLRGAFPTCLSFVHEASYRIFLDSFGFHDILCSMFHVPDVKYKLCKNVLVRPATDELVTINIIYTRCNYLLVLARYKLKIIFMPEIDTISWSATIYAPHSCPGRHWLFLPMLPSAWYLFSSTRNYHDITGTAAT